MIRFARSAVALIGAIVLLALAACGGSSPVPSPSASPSPPLPELGALAEYFGAQEAWWMAVTPDEAQRMVDDPSWADPDPNPSATIYVVLIRGDFNDAGGKHMGWAVTAGRVGADTTTVVVSTRPELAGHSWTALDLTTPQASP